MMHLTSIARESHILPAISLRPYRHPMTKDPLLQPYQLKHLTLRNRIMTTSHEPAYPEDGMPKARYRAYHAERAKAGVALTMTAGSAIVSRDSPPAFNNVLAYRDEVVGWMRELADECHDHGAAVMIQLTHLGWRTNWNKGDWLPVVSPGRSREPAHGAYPKVIEDWDIARIIRDYGDAAERMQAAGLDGIELAATGHLQDSFFSPAVNDFTEEYGGSFNNRMRFMTETLTEIRGRVGPDFIVGIRFAGDDFVEGGVDHDEGVRICTHFRDSGMIDFLNITRGSVSSDARMTKMIPISGMASAPHLDAMGEFRKKVAFPVFHAARIPDVATARHAIATGKLDMVGMTRAHIADPHIVQKITQGREEDIRPCVGATYCLDRIYEGGAALCFHNAATGREETMPHVVAPAPSRRKVVIVGAGMAGLEAARVSAERGHEVIVFEAADAPGGQLRLAIRNPRKAELGSAIDWRMSQCAARDVQFRFNTLASAPDILAEGPDVVIVATGGLPEPTRMPGADLCVSSWDILTRDTPPGDRVLIWDEAGDHAGMLAAEVIAETGADLEVMNQDRSIAPAVMGMNLTPYLAALQPRGVTFTQGFELRSVVQDGNALTCEIGSDYSEELFTRTVDQVVVNNGAQPLDDLYFQLKPQSRNKGAVDYEALAAAMPQPNIEGDSFLLYRIGDAVATRNVHAAVFDALRLAKDI